MKYCKLYLKPVDLKGKTVTVKISRFFLENHYSIKAKCEVSTPVIEFEGKKRALILNNTQCDDISRATGEEDDENKWVGHSVSLSPVKSISGKETIKISAPRFNVPQAV
jgi:hypothetical protein